jgi:hypothetical protein
MGRFVRSFFTLLALASLLLALAAAGMWVRSRSTADSVPRVVEANQFQLHSAAGRLVFLSTRDDFPKPDRLIDVRWLQVGDERVPLPGIDRALRQRLLEERGTLRTHQFTIRAAPAALANGFGFDVDVRTTRGGWYVVVPYWAVVVLTLALPAVVFGSRAWRRGRAGRRRLADRAAG